MGRNKNVFFSEGVNGDVQRIRPDKSLPQSRAGGQGPYFRSLEHLGRSSETQDRKNMKKVARDSMRVKR